MAACKSYGGVKFCVIAFLFIYNEEKSAYVRSAKGILFSSSVDLEERLI